MRKSAWPISSSTCRNWPGIKKVVTLWCDHEMLEDAMAWLEHEHGDGALVTIKHLGMEKRRNIYGIRGP